MNNDYLATRVRELRTQRGMSQEALAEASGVSHRTVQRIENGESNPTGDTIKRLSNSLEVKIDELIDWNMQEDNGYLVFMSLSALSFIVFPILGILLPFIMWTAKKDQVKGVDKIGKDLVNFEINWVILLVMLPLTLFLLAKIGVLEDLAFFTVILITIFTYVINMAFILISSFRISTMKSPLFYSIITFLK